MYVCTFFFTYFKNILSSNMLEFLFESLILPGEFSDLLLQLARLAFHLRGFGAQFVAFCFMFSFYSVIINVTISIRVVLLSRETRWRYRNSLNVIIVIQYQSLEIRNRVQFDSHSSIQDSIRNFFSVLFLPKINELRLQQTRACTQCLFITDLLILSS